MPDNNEQPVDKQTTNEGQGEQPTQEQQGEQPADQNNKTIAYGKTSSGTIKVTIEEEKPRNMTLTLQNIQSIADYGRRSHDKWVINERSGSSLMFRNNGQSSLAASKYAQYKLNPEGASQEQTLISQTITNRKILQTDELIFNNHKFNTHIIDLSDFRKMKVDTNQNCVVGNFTVYGSVLVKAWEENLKRYMLIRRPVRMPLFSPLLNVPDIMPAVGITSPLKRTADLVGISDKGYQVNMIIFDHKTLIGKEGVDRSGINRTPEGSGGIINGGSGSNSSSSSSGSRPGKPASVGPAPGKGAENIPSGAEQWTIDLAKRCSDKCGIPADWIWAQWAMESGHFSSYQSVNYNNYGGVKDNSTGTWKVFSSPEEYADYFAWFITQWNDPPTTGAKTMYEYCRALQEPGDGSQYCGGESTDEYYNKVLSTLGNEGTKL